MMIGQTMSLEQIRVAGIDTIVRRIRKKRATYKKK